MAGLPDASGHRRQAHDHGSNDRSPACGTWQPSTPSWSTRTGRSAPRSLRSRARRIQPRRPPRHRGCTPRVAGRLCASRRPSVKRDRPTSSAVTRRRRAGRLVLERLALRKTAPAAANAVRWHDARGLASRSAAASRTCPSGRRPASRMARLRAALGGPRLPTRTSTTVIPEERQRRLPPERATPAASRTRRPAAIRSRSQPGPRRMRARRRPSSPPARSAIAACAGQQRPRLGHPRCRVMRPDRLRIARMTMNRHWLAVPAAAGPARDLGQLPRGSRVGRRLGRELPDLPRPQQRPDALEGPTHEPLATGRGDLAATR